MYRSGRFLLRSLAWTLSLLTFVPDIACAQDSASHALVIEGRELQNCVVTIRYFDNRKLTKTVAARVTLVNGRAEEPIEAKHEGIEIFVQSASSPIQTSLRSKTEVLAEDQLDQPGVAKLSVGRLGRVPFQPIAIELSQKESNLVNALIKAAAEKTPAKSLVSSSPQANLDGPSLDVFLRELTTLIGPPLSDQDASHGWIGWTDQQGNRVLAGVLNGERGPCGLRLALKDNKLVDVRPNSAALGDNYYREPVDVQPYVRQAKQLTQFLFDGNAAKALQQYSPKFQQQITEEQLFQFSDRIRQQYGTVIKAIDLKRYEVAPYDFAQKSTLLNLDLLVELDNGKRCVSRTVFNIPNTRHQLGKAHLGAVTIQEVFQSSHPELAKATEKLFIELAGGLQANPLIEMYPPELQAIANAEKLQATWNRLSDHLKGRTPTVDFDLWAVESHEGKVLASGPVDFGTEDFVAEIHFVGENMLGGIALVGPSLAESTFGDFSFDPSLKDLAQRFWTHLLSDQIDEAYGLLAPELQQRLSLEQLKDQWKDVEQGSTPLKSVVVDHMQLVTNVYRPLPVMAILLLTATFADDSQLALACDLATPAEPNEKGSLVYDFSDEFDLRFPVESIPILKSDQDGGQLALDALLSSDADALSSLVAPKHRETIDQATLAAYLKQLQQIGGQLVPPTSVARTVEYHSGNKHYRCDAVLRTQDGQSIPVEIWFRREALERFAVSDPRMNDFVRLVEDRSGIHQRIDGFVQSWFGDSAKVASYMLQTTDMETQLKSLEALREHFEREHGKLKGFTIGEPSPYEGDGSLEFEVALKGERSDKNVRVRVEVGAFDSFISGINF